MFDYLYEWIRNLSCYMVLVTAFVQMIPNQAYKKYIRFFTGLLLILLLVTPVFKLFGVKQDFSEIYESRLYEQHMREIEEASRYLESVDVGDYLPEAEEEEKGMRMEDVKIGW